jgi:phenylpyruvate tautomerase PptA (4-oxalocrotonate tautomerase family)
MPIQSISMYAGRTLQQKRRIAECVQEALVYAGYPDNDRFQKLTEYNEDSFFVDSTFPNFSSSPRTKEFLLIEIWISAGRPDTMKQDMLDRITENLQREFGMRRSDIMVVFCETARENSSLYRGLNPEDLPPVRPRVQRVDPPA